MSDIEATKVFESAQSLSPDRFYANLVRCIFKTPFLQVVNYSEITRSIKIVSSRENDPKGLIEISVSKRADSTETCILFIKVRDKQFVKDLQSDKIPFRPGVKGTLTQILIGNAYLFENDGKRRGQVRGD
ncbi:MAG TPA: hypothetical protein VHK86_00285 [Nitrososphaera sp.]|nr:hypothetical protein [Nitrososphaera sp.]